MRTLRSFEYCKEIYFIVRGVLIVEYCRQFSLRNARGWYIHDKYNSGVQN